MKRYPSIVEYEKAIRTFGSRCLNLLGSYEFIPNKVQPIKVFKVASGSFAIVFKVREIGTGTFFALRGFLNMANPEKIDRTIKISNNLQTISESWICKTQFFPRGFVIDNEQYPVILMEWCNGIPLNEYISTILHNNEKISELQRKIVELSLSLEVLEIAHGDIHAGNILVESINSEITLKLVDYDPMYVSELKGELAMEIGHSSYQHPKRDKFYYDETIDRFSFWLLLTSLEALKFDKSLWKKDNEGGFNDEDNLLFKAKDLENPSYSALIQKLKKINQTSINYYLYELLSDEFSPKREKVSLYQEEVSIVKPNRLKEPTTALINEKSIKATPKTTQVSNGAEFLINSIPNGADVYFGNQYLGITPIRLPISLFSSRMIKLTYNGKTKTFPLNRNQTEYTIDILKNNSSISSKITSTITPKEERKTSSLAFILFILFTLLGIIIITISLQYIIEKNIYKMNNVSIEEMGTEEVAIEEPAPVNYEYSEKKPSEELKKEVETHDLTETTKEYAEEITTNYYSDYEVKEKIEKYYNALFENNYYVLYDIFPYRVNRFYDKYNVSPDEIIQYTKSYASVYPYQDLNVDYNSFVIRRYGDDITAKYNVNFKIKKNYDDIWKYFYLTIYVEFDENLRIKSIYEMKN